MQLPQKNLGFGVGLRSCHFQWLMQHIDPNKTGVDWFEIISENFIDNHGYARHVLFKLREYYPFVMHGVSLSIGSTDPLNFAYLEKLKQLAHDLEPEWVSDHLCWTGVQSINSHDLLPMPLTRESLNHVARRIHQVQEYLERPLILENPSSYLEYQQSEFKEWEFLNYLCELTGCGLLVDVNNIYVSAFNHGFDAHEYLDNLPAEHIVQCHLAGPTDCGTHLIDTHDQPVVTEVWQLYQQLYQKCGEVSTLLEWDANIPDFPKLVEELHKAKNVIAGELPITQQLEKATEALSNPIHETLNLKDDHVILES